MKLLLCNAYLISTVGTDGLVLQHQGMRSHNAEYAPMHLHMCMGWIVSATDCLGIWILKMVEQLSNLTTPEVQWPEATKLIWGQQTQIAYRAAFI